MPREEQRQETKRGSQSLVPDSSRSHSQMFLFLGTPVPFFLSPYKHKVVSASWNSAPNQHNSSQHHGDPALN